jgi:hypothetical protein
MEVIESAEISALIVLCPFVRQYGCGLAAPRIPVPLREDIREVPLDLQFVFNKTYGGGPYLRGAVDYSQPPNPRLGEIDRDWALRLLRDNGLAGAPAS